jgi:hypothetical protein
MDEALIVPLTDITPTVILLATDKLFTNIVAEEIVEADNVVVLTSDATDILFACTIPLTDKVDPNAVAPLTVKAPLMTAFPMTAIRVPTETTLVPIPTRPSLPITMLVTEEPTLGWNIKLISPPEEDAAAIRSMEPLFPSTGSLIPCKTIFVFCAVSALSVPKTV